MQRALNLARGASIARASPRHPSYSLLRSAPSLQLFGRSYATDTSPEDSGIASSSTDSSTPRPTPPTREQLLELFKQSEENVDLEELIASLSQTPEAGESDKPLTLQDAFPLDSTIQEFKGDDSTSLGHRMLAEQRIVLDYFRKIETELPSLKGAREVEQSFTDFMISFACAFISFPQALPSPFLLQVPYRRSDVILQ